MTRDEILAAIRRAAVELGRAPSRGELRRITGVSHYRVLAEFPTLREAVRAAGLEPNPKGEKISTEDLLADWKRVAEKLGRRPSRAEYVREGRYSAGAFVGRFGSWGNISTTEDTGKHRGSKSVHRGGAETRRRSKPDNHKGHEETQRGSGGLEQSARVVSSDESVVRNFDCVPLAPIPAPVVGMRRVTEAVAQMVVNTLMGTRSDDLVIGRSGDLHPTTRNPRALGTPDLRTSVPVAASLDDEGTQRGSIYRLAPRGIRKDRPVMGEPFDRRPMTNAPVNELGVMVLFGMVAAGLGLQVESVQGKFPDCIAKRQVAPGKWQHLRIEFEYESRNFKLHGHDPKGCDMIVCWKHNWKDCPAEIEVVELSKLIG